MRLSSRAGFTLVEVLIAVVLIDFALLAMVGASASLLRRDSELRTRRTAAQTATNRLAMLAAGACAAANGSVQTSQGLSESWLAVPGPDSVRELRDSVSFVVRGATHAVVLRMYAPC